MFCLGIESTAHTFGIGIVDNKGKILANERATFTTEEGGIQPREAANCHLENAETVLTDALEKSKLNLREIDAIAFSRGPGLGPCLSVGAVFARSISLLLNKPLISVNHCVAHIEIGKLGTGCIDPIVGYMSGGNSQIIGYENGCYRVYGETLDIGVGNLLDTFGRELGLGFPAGPIIDKLYFETEEYVKLPYTVKGMDLIFGGLLTAAKKKIPEYSKEVIAYSLMHNAFCMVTEVLERGLAHTGKNEILLVGGVSCSKALQKMIREMAVERGAKVFVPEKDLLVDNGAMIAWNGIQKYNAKDFIEWEESRVDQRFRTDLEKVSWK